MRPVIDAREQGRIQPVVRSAWAHLFGAQAHTPVADRLVDALQVPAGLERPVRAGLVDAGDVVVQCATADAAQKLPLQLEVRVHGIAVRRPFPDRIGDPDPGAATEGVGDCASGGVGRHQALIVGLRVQRRQPGAPAVAVADVAAGVHDQCDHPRTVATRVGTRETAAATQLDAQLDVLVGGRDPGQLYPIVSVLRT